MAQMLHKPNDFMLTQASLPSKLHNGLLTSKERGKKLKIIISTKPTPNGLDKPSMMVMINGKNYHKNYS